MTATTTTVLPPRERSGEDGLSTLPVLGGYASDGEAAGVVFLWAHTRHANDFEYALHRHEGLEILTVLVDGAMSHYDTATARWVDLHPGDVQFIASASGVSHIERAAAGTRGFQIQFDPGYEAALQQQPSYTDFPAALFTAHPDGDALVTDLVGGDGPIQPRTEGLSVRRVRVPAGAHATLRVGADRFTLAYVIDGAATVNGAHAGVDDAVALHGASVMTVDASAPTDLLVASTPTNPSYQPRRFDPRQRGDGVRPPYLTQPNATQPNASAPGMPGWQQTS